MEGKLPRMKNKEIVRSIIQAFLSADVETALSYMTDDVKMRWPGYFDLEQGKNAIREFYKDVPELVASELGDIIEEGDLVVGNGKMTALHNDGEIKSSFFCDIYTLKNGMVKEIVSHVVFETRNG